MPINFILQGKDRPKADRFSRTCLWSRVSIYNAHSFFVYIKPLAVPGVKAYSVIKKYPSFWFKINSRSANCEN